MKRVMIMTTWSFLITAVWQGLAVKMPSLVNVLFLPPLILVFLNQYCRPLESIATVLLLGFVLDVLGGFVIGFNILFMLISVVIMYTFNFFSGRIHKGVLVYYVMFISLMYRILFLAVQIIVFGPKANMYLAQVFLGPIIDGIMSLPFYAGMVELLAVSGCFDKNEYYKSRIGYHQ